MKDILQVRWLGKWLDVKNPLFNPANYPPFNPSEEVDSGAFRRFNSEGREALLR